MTEPAQRKHHQLQAWQVAMRLAREIYGLTSRFPAHEQYGLTSQLRRSAVSVPSNIAEGAARSSTKEFLHFLSEIDTQLMLAHDVRFIEDERLPQIMETLDHAFGVQGGLINSLKTRI
jgi:four helix bundle protein